MTKASRSSADAPVAGGVPSHADDPWRALRAWSALVRISFFRHFRSHWLVWISIVLLSLSIAVTGLFTAQSRWTMAHWRHPPNKKGIRHDAHLENVRLAATPIYRPEAQSLLLATTGAVDVTLREVTGFAIFSNFMVLSIFATFLLPIFSVAFASEALGREREAGNLLWVLTRPISRPAIFLAKFVAVLPWCLLLNVGGFGLICLTAGPHGRTAWTVYWPAAFFGTIAFASFFHMLAAWWKRAALLGLLYAFFVETVVGNLPGQFKRLSISYYVRSLMFDRADTFGYRLERSATFVMVDGFVASVALLAASIVFLALGAFLFSRNECLDLD